MNWKTGWLISGLYLCALSLNVAQAEILSRPLSGYREGGCSPTREFRAYQASEILTLDEFFADNQLQGLNAEFGNATTLFEMDEVFANQDLSSLVLLKFCLEPVELRDQNQLFQVGEDVLYHSKTQSGIPFALYFVGFDEGRIRDLTTRLSTLLAALTEEKHSKLWDLVSPSAYARPGYHDGVPPSRWKEMKERRHPSKSQSTKNPPKSEMQNVLSGAGSCGKGVLKGAYNATVGVVETTVKFAFRFVKSTWFAISKPREAWQKLSQQTKNAVNLIRNFSLSKAFKGGMGGFNAMPTNDKIQFICKLLTEVGAGVSLGIFAVPAASEQISRLWEILNSNKSFAKFQKWFDKTTS